MEKYLENLFKKKKFELSDLEYLIDNTKSKEHFFVINEFSNNYFEKLAKYINFATLNINSINLYKKFFKEKLQFNLYVFNETQFFQILAEVVVVGGVYELINDSPTEFSDFELEKKFGLKKDVDSSVFWVKEKCNLNIEVKCPDYDCVVDYNKEILWGRLKNKKFNEKLHVRRRDGKAKSYLISSHEKFEGSSKEDVNLMVVCVSDFIDQAEWVSYYIQNETEDYTGGILVSPEAYDLKVCDYENVDFIIISDVYIRMKETTGKDFINLNQCHNSIFPNDNSLRNRYFLNDLTPLEIWKIKNIKTNEELMGYEKKYPKYFKYFKVSKFFNAISEEFIKFYEENKNVFNNKNWMYYYFLIRRDVSLTYPYIKVEVSEIDVICCRNKYSSLIENNKINIVKGFKENNISNIVFEDFFNFLDKLDDRFIESLSSQLNIHKMLSSGGEYDEFVTFINLGLNLFLLKNKYEKHTPVKLIFKA